jgi:O-antigen/teichoic acid export membrane protein
MLPVIFFALIIMIIIYSIFIRKADKTLWELGFKPVVKLLVEELLYPIFFLLSFIQPRTVCLCLCLSTQTVHPAV